MQAATRALATLLASACLAPAAAGSKSLAVLTDGRFDEWAGRRPRVSDPAGDGEPGGLDLGRLWLADDGQALFLRLEVGRESLLQNSPIEAIGNLLRLYIDTDRKRTTGMPVGGLGVDLEVRFGERQIVRYDADGISSFEQPGAGAVQALPTYSSDAFEIRVELPPADKRPGKRRKLRLFLREESPDGDRLPNSGALTYRLGRRAVAAPEAIELARAPGDSLRIVSINVEDARTGVVPEIYARFFEAVQPDIVCMQELAEWGPELTAAFLETALPLGGGRTWTVVQIGDIHTASSLPVRAAASVDTNLVIQIELPAHLGGRDLVLFNAHPPCCGNDAGRDREVDHLMATWRDLLAGGGPFAIDPEDPMVLLGDMNLVGYRRQFLALRDGVFVDPANGPDFAPGRDEGSLREAPLRHTHRRLIHTWRRARSDFSPGKLDFVLYTGDALKLTRSFVPDTEGMPEQALEAAGLELGDTLEMSDHLPLVVDFVPR